MGDKKILRKVILVVAILLMIMGILNGDLQDVMNKANRICYECIGIG